MVFHCHITLPGANFVKDSPPAFGRHHKRGAAAFGRGTSFVVSFVVAMNRVDVVDLDVELVDVDLVDVDLDVGVVDVDVVDARTIWSTF